MSAPTPPTLSEIMAAMAALRPTPSPDTGLAKHASTIVVAILLALCLWVGSSVSSLSTIVTRMSANFDALQKSITDLQQTQGSAATQLSDARAANAKQDARLDAFDADLNRLKERTRMLEGQKPVYVSPSEYQ